MLRWAVLPSVNRRLLGVTKRTFNSSVPDYYKLLGVKKDATQREIKLAYYGLSKKYHPDVAGTSQDASSKFLQINDAYECLKDPEKRRAYDNQTTGGGNRYPGDFGGSYQGFQQGGWQNQRTYSNPFHNKQFTEAEYRRIWQEFERLRKQQQHQTQNDFRWSAFERDKIWNDLRRAKRWQEFHARYPNGAPGSFRWEWKFGGPESQQNQNNQRQAYRGWDIFRRLMMMYFMCFFFVSVVRVLLYSFDGSTSKNPQQAANAMALESAASKKESVEKMMRRVPGGQDLPSYMTTPPMGAPENKRNSSNNEPAVSNLEFMMYQPPPPDRPIM